MIDSSCSNSADKVCDLKKEFTDKLFTYLTEALVAGPLTYGFEYEFIPENEMTLTQIEMIKEGLPKIGFKAREDGSFQAADGLDVSFEPGGQLEYGSPPLLADDDVKFTALLDHLLETSQMIAEKYGIRYLATAYAPGRADAPLCITGQRYLDMHSFFTENGGRGREMMKGTASIQLHVRLRSLDEMVPLFKVFDRLANDPDFAMSPARRAIWDKTDVSRCLLPELGEINDIRELLSHIVEHALQAVDFSHRVPFAELEDPSFELFLTHLTTIFTDVRLNLKGPTFELRTMDSLPVADFRKRWQRFIREIESTFS